MIFDKEGNTTIVFQEKPDIATFLDNFKNGYPKIKSDHIILNLFSFKKLTANDILEFLDISNRHRSSLKSFVIVTEVLSYDDIPDEISVAPSIQEAKDIIEMEEIERELDL
ncbi:ribonuclease Z [Costertonia aggregata]|uniref:Ribonuclease Z n=1 Tax=Costertonia aggregata TaxID=343403 RepID=A0A7H9ASN3_9FLAO|nr:ribonuclease Z [Costertonia aggregata]QLG46464.1 ribonuclease Z [Costertonia aggregata]